MNTELFVDTKYILNLAIACYRLPYLAIAHMNYRPKFSTCLHYELTNCKIGPTSTDKQGHFQLYTVLNTS